MMEQDNIIPVTNIQPGNNILVDKTFTLTGINTTSGLDMPFTISFEYQNTFKNNELVYFLKRIDDSENVVVDIDNGLNTNGPLTQKILEQSGIGLPQDLVGYYVNFIKDWSNNPYSQEIASGRFNANSENETITFNLKMMFIDIGSNQDYNKGATFNGKIVVTAPETSKFATDTWEEIANNVKSGNASKYIVGSEKEVEIGGQNYTVRVANNTTPEECTIREDFSQTACGVVVEFVDIVENKRMNPSGEHNGKNYQYGWNVGGWPASEMWTYANGDFYNKLPAELRNVIIDTKVVSGYGSSDTSNFPSTDKIYLLSAHEVYEDGTSNQVSSYDKAWDKTRQLDYYKIKGVTIESYSGAIKNYNGSASAWRLRAAYSNSDHLFLGVGGNGDCDNSNASHVSGFAPAFRIG